MGPEDNLEKFSAGEGIMRRRRKAHEKGGLVQLHEGTGLMICAVKCPYANRHRSCSSILFSNRRSRVQNEDSWDRIGVRSLLANTRSPGCWAALTITHPSPGNGCLIGSSSPCKYWVRKIYLLTCLFSSARAARGGQGWFHPLFWDTAALFVFHGWGQLEHLEQRFLCSIFTMTFHGVFPYWSWAQVWCI